MPVYAYKTAGVCSSEIRFELDENDKIHRVQFIGGCPGNLLAIGKLTEGKDAREIIALLSGNDCGGKGTSCADQFAHALKQALAAKPRRANARS